MRKPAVVFILILTLGLLSAGALYAQDELPEEPAVDVVVLDENGFPANTEECGDVVTIDVTAWSGEEWIEDAEVYVYVPDSLIVIPEDAMMTWDGVNWISNLDPIEGGFFYYDDFWEDWVWDLGEMYPYEMAELTVPAVVDVPCNTVEEITVETEFWGYWYNLRQEWEEELLSYDDYTFRGICICEHPCPHPPCRGPCVPMQPTGAPLALAALALVGMISGTAYMRLK